uniref:Uncharacterized protein n=1 Tax=Wuchereria bancrofti TaxID=6293 RepID=A0AAF5PJ92_WUCBA
MKLIKTTMFEVTNHMTDWQDLEKNEGLLAVQESHFHGTEGWRKKKKRIYAKLRAVGRMNWALSMARTLLPMIQVL